MCYFHGGPNYRRVPLDPKDNSDNTLSYKSNYGGMRLPGLSLLSPNEGEMRDYVTFPDQLCL